MATHQWIRNPETDGTWHCPMAVLDTYLARGWELSEEPTDDEAHLHDPEVPHAVEIQPTSVLKADLVKQAGDYGLDTSGTKAELQARIREHLNVPDPVPDESTSKAAERGQSTAKEQ